MKRTNVDALFLGPKAENRDFFKEMLNFMVDDHIGWRESYQPDDKPVIAARDRKREDFGHTLEKSREVLVDLAARLQIASMPWFSPRYLGHMNSDTLMAATLGYMLTLLYNPNNCAYEGSPATTGLEIEVGRQLAKLMGYDPARSWGHIASGGTIANYEGLWMARNLKSIPLAVKEVCPALVDGLADWQLLNLPTERILDLLDRVKAEGEFDAVRDRSARGTGIHGGLLGKVVVPRSKHYSWVKAVDILGIGRDSLLQVNVKDNYRMDVVHLKTTIDDLISRRIPIMAVVAVMGTTEEGSVDELHEIVKLRKAYEEKGVSFYLHVDAAYGGYARAVFLDENDDFMNWDRLTEGLCKAGIFRHAISWPEREIYEAFKAMPEADSITVDPHKMGYIPYAAGAIVAKDRRVIDLISYFAAYVFEKAEDQPSLLGSYIMEGSKAGAAVAAVWTAHKVLPLNVTGYGRIIGCSIEGAERFYRSLLTAPPIEIQGRGFKVHPLVKPDFNMVDFAFRELGDDSLEAANRLNRMIYERCSYKGGPVYLGNFITSKTELSFEEYGDAPRSFVSAMGLPIQEWDTVKSVFVLRSCVLTPYLAKHTTFDEYWGAFLKTMWNTLEAIITNEGA